MNAVLRPDKKVLESPQEVEVQLDKFTLDDDSPFINKSIRESGIRSSTNGLVVGIERNGQRILNPESDTILQPDDVVWIVGEKKLLETIG